MLGDGLEVQGPCLGVIVGRFHEEGEKNRFDQIGSGEAEAAEVDRGRNDWGPVRR
jgi:hypothetical protein